MGNRNSETLELLFSIIQLIQFIRIIVYSY